MRPQAAVDRLKPVPPMHANDLPVVGQALSPANRIISQLLRERSPGERRFSRKAPPCASERGSDSPAESRRQPGLAAPQQGWNMRGVGQFECQPDGVMGMLAENH